MDAVVNIGCKGENTPVNIRSEWRIPLCLPNNERLYLHTLGAGVGRHPHKH